MYNINYLLKFCGISLVSISILFLYSVFAGTSFTTILPAAITAFSPIVIPGIITQFAPIDAPFFTTVFSYFSGYFFERGYLSLVKDVWGPINTSSSIVTPSHN